MKFEDVLVHFGSRVQIAAALEVSEQAVRRWEKEGLPKMVQWALSWKTKGKLK